MKKLLFGCLINVSFMAMAYTDDTCRLEKQWMDLFQVYEDISESDFQAITNLDVSSSDKINALSEDDYAFYIANIVESIFYFSTIDLFIEGLSEENVQHAYKILRLLNECRPVYGILSVIFNKTSSDDEKRILQDIEFQLKNKSKKLTVVI